VPTPALDGLVALGSVMLGRDLAREATTLDHLGVRAVDLERRIAVGRRGAHAS